MLHYETDPTDRREKLERAIAAIGVALVTALSTAVPLLASMSAAR